VVGIIVIIIINPKANPILINAATLRSVEFRVGNHVMATHGLMRE
jgi:hypothetical protein